MNGPLLARRTKSASASEVGVTLYIIAASPQISGIFELSYIYLTTDIFLRSR